MPGHKLGRGFMPQSVFTNPALLDVTELDVTDDLSCPHGPLLEAQYLASRAFGAGRTWFLANGSSCGIYAMIAAACAPGEKLLISRDFHFSAFNAMRFARVKPVYIPLSGYNHTSDERRLNEDAFSPDPYCLEGGNDTGGGNPGEDGTGGGNPDVDAVEAAIEAHPDATALYITRPGYYGNVCDIVEISRLAHRRGVKVLVDEAHGAHLSFNRRLPVGAMGGGADYCVQSAHKTLPAFTQCAYAHASAGALKADAAGIERMSEALRVFQTSSPSFILTASLDYAREYMEEYGANELNRILDNCEEFYRRAADAGYGVPGNIWSRPGSGAPGITRESFSGGSGAPRRPPIHATNMVGAYGRDMTRLVLDTKPLGLSGIETDRMLWERYKIKIEMSDLKHIVMITTVADRDEDFEMLIGALTEIAHTQGKHSATVMRAACGSGSGSGAGPGAVALPPPGTSESRASACPAPERNPQPREHCPNTLFTSTTPDFITELHKPRRRIQLEASIGYPAAEIVTPYPPGIPLLCPGEKVTRGAVDKLVEYINAGIRINGIYTEGRNFPEIVVYSNDLS